MHGLHDLYYAYSIPLLASVLLAAMIYRHRQQEAQIQPQNLSSLYKHSIGGYQSPNSGCGPLVAGETPKGLLGTKWLEYLSQMPP